MGSSSPYPEQWWPVYKSSSNGTVAPSVNRLLSCFYCVVGPPWDQPNIASEARPVDISERACDGAMKSASSTPCEHRVQDAPEAEDIALVVEPLPGFDLWSETRLSADRASSAHASIKARSPNPPTRTIPFAPIHGRRSKGAIPGWLHDRSPYWVPMT